MKIKNLFSASEIKDIENALTQAELGSDGEIVPIFAKSSGNYPGAQYILAILLAVAVTILVAFLSDSKSLIILSLILSLILGIKLVSKLPCLFRYFITTSEMEDEVSRRAREYFYSYGLGATKNGSALLIYVSCFERMAIVRTDLRSKDIVSDQDLQEVCDLITQGMKDKKPADGLIKAIEKHGNLLKEYFPNDSSVNPNELPNKLYLID
jgi:putative membrane protein